ncbi:MAG: flagellar hook-associated protein FlgK [Actinomycetales bacterium]|nr:flagellar hook-associated protein FlgK [Actinomycetales bacterium]
MSGFSTLNTAVSGLGAAQRAMDVASQNIVNANTPGYSRQRVDLAAIGAPPTTGIFTGSDISYGGVDVTGVVRIRDTFLEGARAIAGGKMSALETRSSALTGVEQLLGEPGDTGLQAVLEDFFVSWHDVAQHPTDSSAGSVVIQRGRAVAQQLAFVATGISERWRMSYGELENTVAEANQAAVDLAGVNGRIQEGEMAGRAVNELKDQRDQLVRTLGELVGGVAVPGEHGMVSVNVNGIDIVSGRAASPFTLVGGENLAQAVTDPPRLVWNDTTVPVSSGAAGGLLGVLGADFPAIAADVDAVAVSLRDAVNTLHAGGYTLDGAGGSDFFEGEDALTLSVVVTDPSELAIAAAPGIVDGSVAMAIGDLVDDRYAEQVLGGPGPAVLWRDLATELGVQVQSVERALDVQQAVLTTADVAVESDAGVNLDEELTSMILFQRAYEASARVITTVDEMLDVLVNRTGVVGR